MKWVVPIVAVAVAGYFGFRYHSKRAAEEALVTAVCAQELTEGVMENFATTRDAMKNGASVLEGAALAYQRKALYTQIQKLVIEDAPMVFLLVMPTGQAASAKVKGFTHYPTMDLYLKAVSLEK